MYESKTIKIAFVTFEYPPFVMGGAGVYAKHITEELAKLGHQITVFTPRIGEFDDKEYFDNKLRIIRVKINNRIPFKALQFWLKLPKEIENAEKNCKFDLIHFNGLSYCFLKKKVSNAYHLATINHLVGDTVKNNNLGVLSRIKGVSEETNFLMPSIESRCIKNSDRIIAISEFTKNRIIDKHNVISEKISVINDGVNFDGYEFSNEELKKTKHELGLLKCRVIIFVGRVDDYRKGLDIAF